jgi:Zn-dependent protease with chaperone function
MKLFRYTFLVLCLVIVCRGLHAQESLIDANKNEFLSKNKDSEFVKEFLKRHTDTVSFKYKKDYQQLLLNISKSRIEYLDDQLICRDTEVNNYLNQIYQKLKKSNPSISNDLIILSSHSLSLNASYLGFNVIIVNNGLLYKFDTEDQIAIVLAHEIAHHQLNHVYNRVREATIYKNDKGLQKDIKVAMKSKEKPIEKYEALMKSLTYDFLRHSRDNEHAADSLAFIYAHNAGYSSNEFVKSYSFLKENDDHSDEKADTITVDALLKEYMSDDIIPFLQQQRLSQFYNNQNKSNEIKDEINNKQDVPGDTLSTHPDLDKRIGFFKNQAEVYSNLNNIDSIPISLKNKVFSQNISWLITAGDGDLGVSLYSILYLLNNNRLDEITLKEAFVFVLQHIASKSKSKVLSAHLNLPGRGFHPDINYLFQVMHSMSTDELLSLAKNTYMKYAVTIEKGKNASLLQKINTSL